MKKFLRIFVLAFLLTATASVLPVPGAAHGINKIAILDDSPNKDQIDRSIYDSTFRSINRWGDASTSFFSKYDKFSVTQVFDQAQRNLGHSTGLSIGNFFQSTTSNFVQWAATFNAIDQLGSTLEAASRSLVEAVFEQSGASAALIVLVAAGLFVWIFITSFRGGLRVAGRRALASGVLLAILYTMAQQTMAAPDNVEANGTYQPVPLTPGWVAKGTKDFVSSLAEMPAQVFVDATVQARGAKASESNLTCANFEYALTSQLNAEQKRAKIAGSSGLVSIISLMDQLWEDTGLNVYKSIQVGTNNPYGDKVYCRILEAKSSLSVPGVSSYLSATGQTNYEGWVDAIHNEHMGKNVPFTIGGAGSDAAANYVAWAACKPIDVSAGTIQWQWEPGWIGFRGGTGALSFEMTEANAAAECGSWWTATMTEGKVDIPNIFDISGDAKWINDRTDSAKDPLGVRDFLFALTGVNPSGGMIAIFAYTTGSFLQFVAFGFLAILTIIANLFSALFVISLWFVLMFALFSRNPFGDHVLKAFKKFLGMTLLASMMTVIMAFVLIFSRALTLMGASMSTPGSATLMIWSGLSPFLAVLLLHFLFTKQFKMSSPFTPSGAKALFKDGTSGALGSKAMSFARKHSPSTRKTQAGKDTAKPDSSNQASKQHPETLGNGKKNKRRSSVQPAPIQSQDKTQANESKGEEGRPNVTAARKWHRKTYGVAAPGDMLGTVSDKVASTPLAQELRSRSEHRAMGRSARTNSAEFAKLQIERRKKLSSGTRILAAGLDAPAAATHRARLGVQNASHRLWNSPKVLGARVDATLRADRVHQAVQHVKESDLAKDLNTLQKGVRRPIDAARAQKQNNLNLLEQYRSAAPIEPKVEPKKDV